ncbi:MAG: MarR family transcriptional regulator [Gammaproteobacteria bacterium]
MDGNEPAPVPEGSAAPVPCGPAHSERVRTIIQQLRVVYRTIQEHSRWVQKRYGLSAAQLWAVWEIYSRSGLRVSELSGALSIHPSTASNLLDKLEKKQLVRRERSGADHRVVRLYVTERGSELVSRTARPAQGALTDALDHLPHATLAELERALGELVAAMAIEDRGAALEPMDGD